MIMTDFEESNSVFRGNGDDVADLQTYTYVDEQGTPRIISCWELTPEEILNLIAFKRVWLRVNGTAMPPVYLEATSPFMGSTRLIDLTDTERANKFKERLANALIAEKGYDSMRDKKGIEWRQHFDTADLRSILIEFLDFIIARGET